MGHESHSSFKDRDRLDRGTPDSPKHFYVAARYRSQAPVRVPFRGPPLRAAPVSALGSVGFWVFAGVPGSGPGCAPALAGRWFVSGGLRVLGVGVFSGPGAGGVPLRGWLPYRACEAPFFREASSSKNFSRYGSTDPRSRDDIPWSNDPRMVLAACHTSGELELRGPGKSARGSFESDCRLAISYVYCMIREAG